MVEVFVGLAVVLVAVSGAVLLMAALERWISSGRKRKRKSGQEGG